MDVCYRSIAGFLAFAAVVAAVTVATNSYLLLFGRKGTQTSRKGQQAKAMRESYRVLAKENGFEQKEGTAAEEEEAEDSTMQILELWIYPIKSLRGCLVDSALLTAEGFYLDRRFMLMKDHGGSPRKLENMAISGFPSMCLFHTSLSDSKLTISYRAPGTLTPSSDPKDQLDISLDPESKEFENLEPMEVNMHGSPSIGYSMGLRCNEWFTFKLGYPAILIFWGQNPRPVLGNLPGRPASQGPKSPNAVTKVLQSIPVLSRIVGEQEVEGIAFNDCAPYLVISSSSVADVTSRLPPDTTMDLTKFRANIVVSTPLTTAAYEEDFWGELTFPNSGSKIFLTGNCGRCKSLNIDYESGESGKGKDGRVLQLLQKDRRVDAGWKYTPIFGRYGFVDRKGEGRVLRVGEKVLVSRRNEERTRFFWPGLSN